MKTKIYIKCHDGIDFPRIFDKGDWIDLRAADDIEFLAPNANSIVSFKSIPLGVAMQLPKGYEAYVVSRSSLYKKKGIILVNSLGIIDNSYQGPDDYWSFGALAFRNTKVSKNERIAQFRISLSQKATFWQKIKWLFSSKVELIRVNDLSSENRGGIGSTGGMK